MKSIPNFLCVFLIIVYLLIFTGCHNINSVSNKNKQKIHEAVENASFKDASTYLYQEGTLNVRVDEGIYKAKVISTEYSYNPEKKILYKDSQAFKEEIEILTMDEFASEIIKNCTPSSYCISFSEFFLCIKDSFLKMENIKKGAKRVNDRYYTCEIQGIDIISSKDLLSLLQKIQPDILVKEEDTYEISLLISSDLTKIYPVGSLSLNYFPIIEFQKN